MVLDYGRLDAAWSAIEPLLDHRDLNVSLGGPAGGCWPTTAENIAAWVLRELSARLPRLVEVAVSETPRTWARVWA